jgi:hypothetical protein
MRKLIEQLLSTFSSPFFGIELALWLWALGCVFAKSYLLPHLVFSLIDQSSSYFLVIRLHSVARFLPSPHYSCHVCSPYTILLPVLARIHPFAPCFTIHSAFRSLSQSSFSLSLPVSKFIQPFTPCLTIHPAFHSLSHHSFSFSLPVSQSFSLSLLCLTKHSSFTPCLITQKAFFSSYLLYRYHFTPCLITHSSFHSRGIITHTACHSRSYYFI